MRKAYHEIMDKVKTDDAMRKRVLKNIQSRKQARDLSLLTRFATLAACLLITIGISGLYPWQKKLPAVLPVAPMVQIKLPQQQTPADNQLQAPAPAGESTAQSRQQQQKTPASQPTPTPNTAAKAEPQTPVTAKEVPLPSTPDFLGAATSPSNLNSADELEQKVGFEIDNLNNLPFYAQKVTYTAYGKELAEIRYSNKQRLLIYRKSPGAEDNSGDYTQYDFVQETLQGNRRITLKGNGQLYHLAIWQKYGYSYSLYSSKSMSSKQFMRIILANEE